MDLDGFSIQWNMFLQPIQKVLKLLQNFEDFFILKRKYVTVYFLFSFIFFFVQILPPKKKKKKKKRLIGLTGVEFFYFFSVILANFCSSF
jgi:hypothetical protein